jgi:hypothetical protein
MKKIIRLTESDLTRIVREIIKEEENNYPDDVKKLINDMLVIISKNFKGIKRIEGYPRGEGVWEDKNGKEILQYYNRHFIVNDSLYDELLETFKGVNKKDIEIVLGMFFKKRFPNLKHFGVITFGPRFLDQ